MNHKQTSSPNSLVRGLFLVLVFVVLAPVSAQADPNYEGPLYYGLDPVLRTTKDPRLLGIERLIMRERLLEVGIDPVRDGGASPSLYRMTFHQWKSNSGVDLERKETLLEYNGTTGLMTVIEYPKFFFLFPPAETLPGGLTYYPPRPVQDPVVRLFVDDLTTGAQRRAQVRHVRVVDESLDVAGGGRDGQNNEGLINLTIPIKLPRTLEKIIGRGEKTKIKISGREHIAISGESTVINPFVPTERVTSQSLFPSLDMQQELQVSLSGTIGEKIIIEVDHNSTAIGPEATKIKLMYQGLEDEIIRTIETGDVGLTLPGSQLLGYSSNKSGLFGIKVTGQVGRADFTAVTSKQKAESSAKTFNSKGGEVEDNIIYSYQYLNHRFFKLDLPFGSDPNVFDVPGRSSGDKIEPNSIKVYRLMGAGPMTDRDVRNIAVYKDTTGTFWSDPASPIPDWDTDYDHGVRWREMEFDLMLDVDGGLVAIDLLQQMAASDILAVIYNITDSSGSVVHQVGDRPGVDEGQRVELPNESELYYRMKLLKAPTSDEEPFTFRYVLRNIYSLGGANIDPSTFTLKIERNVTGESFPDIDNAGIPYIRTFGLDQTDQQRTGPPDGLVDINDATMFDFNKGLLKFHTFAFPTPFAAEEEQYTNYAQSSDFDWEGTFLEQNLTPEIYDPDFQPTEYSQYGKFRIVASHASAASSFNLGVSNIEEGSETVTVDGRTLQRGIDYEIDYTFGQIELKGDAANLTADSKVSVNYSYAPFFGGGTSSLMGFNLGYDLGRDSKLSTTWLYQTEDIVGEKAKLGEEPSKTLVGNMNLSHTFKPYFLTHVANFLSLHNTERESSLQFSGEMALSLPNPNTKGKAYLEDFEGVDASDIISLTRTAWSWASAPFQGDDYLIENPADMRSFDPEDRVSDVRWFLPQDRVERRMLNPDLINQERGETQQAMDLYLANDEGWDDENWGGIMRGISRTGTDLSKAQFVEIWLNDSKPDSLDRRGKIHLDFGYINEDGFWPVDETDGSLTIGNWEQEDGILPGEEPDGVWSYLEDVGLDGQGETGPQRYSAEYDADGDAPFPYINGTAKNNREDTEDINGNTRLDRDNGFFTATIDLKDTEALVDVVYDYDDVGDLVSENISWRKYRIRLGDIDKYSGGTSPNLQAVTHVRIWYEDPEPGAPNSVQLQLSDLKFLGSRWEREGIRRVEGEVLLSEGERLPGEEFFLGEVNNKENPDYYPPFTVHEVNNIPEKEQSMVVDIKNLDVGHMVRTSKKVSPRGDDYTGYREMSWYWFNADHNTADLDLFFRVGSDTLNYYEVGYNFANSTRKTGWKYMNVNLAELSNVKNEDMDADGVIHGQVNDTRTGELYPVRVVGRPDLRLIRSYYFVVANNNLSSDASGHFYLNDVKLEGVKKDMGVAQRAGLRLNMADVIKMEFDWSRQDAEYHGLDKRTGSGINNQDWSFATNLNVEDFLPLQGFRLPVNVSRRQTMREPKYETNSDIEIIDEAVADELTSVDTQERFSTRLSHSPSKGAIPRYIIDPWSLLLNGSQGEVNGPTEERYQKTLQGAMNYDLRIPGDYRLGAYPLLKYVPVLRGLSVVPKKVAFGASFNSSYNATTTFDTEGVATPRPITINRPGKLTASMDYKPLSILDISGSGTSDRDLLREHKKFGVNIGEEDKRSYDMRMTITPPLAKDMPGGPIFYPVRVLARGVTKVRPSVTFNGRFTDDHNPAVRQDGDPSSVRNISNDNSWEFRLNVPVGDAFKKVLPEKKYSDNRRNQILEEQRRREAQDRRLGRGGETEGATDEDLTGLTPEEIQRREEERLLREAEERMAEDRDRGLATDEPAKEGGQGLSLAKLYNVGLNPFREITPVKVTYSDRRASAYGRIQEAPSFWYRTGLSTNLSTADSLYVSTSYQERKSLDLSTTSKLARTLSLDVKYAQSTSFQERVSSTTKSYQQNWPDASLNLTGIEKWKFLGGSSDPNSGWFRSSSFNISYKRSKTVNNMTEISYNPAVSTSLNPRLTFNFHNGMTATATATLSWDDATNNGAITDTKRTRYGLQLRHQFRAQKLLAQIGLYRPGSNPTINMDVDVSYQNDKTERFNPGSTSSTPTGTKRWSANPRFSYQVSRNLSGALRFIFSYNKNLATNQSTTSLGLGLEATFVF